MELFGGNVDPGETPLQGLIRELKEEESSGTLAKMASKRKLEPVSTFILDEKMQCIYAVEMDEKKMKRLKAHPDESYGIRILEKRIFDAPETIDLDTFTPKTVRIFYNLGLL